MTSVGMPKYSVADGARRHLEPEDREAATGVALDGEVVLAVAVVVAGSREITVLAPDRSNDRSVQAALVEPEAGGAGAGARAIDGRIGLSVSIVVADYGGVVARLTELNEVADAGGTRDDPEARRAGGAWTPDRDVGLAVSVVIAGDEEVGGGAPTCVGHRRSDRIRHPPGDATTRPTTRVAHDRVVADAIAAEVDWAVRDHSRAGHRRNRDQQGGEDDGSARPPKSLLHSVLLRAMPVLSFLEFLYRSLRSQPVHTRAHRCLEFSIVQIVENWKSAR